MEIIKTDKPKKECQQRNRTRVNRMLEIKQLSMWINVCLQQFITALVHGAKFMSCESGSVVRAGSKHILGILSH